MVAVLLSSVSRPHLDAREILTRTLLQKLRDFAVLFLPVWVHFYTFLSHDMHRRAEKSFSMPKLDWTRLFLVNIHFLSQGDVLKGWASTLKGY